MIHFKKNLVILKAIETRMAFNYVLTLNSYIRSVVIITKSMF